MTGRLLRILSLFLLVAAAPSLSAAPRVLLLDLDRVVHPLTTEIIIQGLEKAHQDGDAAVILRINTPGGLLSATQEIIQAIVASPVPVITYVTPSGGHAASAGFLILVARTFARTRCPGRSPGGR